MKLKFSVLLGVAGLACTLALPAHADSSKPGKPAKAVASKSQPHQADDQAVAMATSDTAAITIAQAATPALLTGATQGTRASGTDNGFPDVNPVFPLKAGHMVCGTSRMPIDVKVEGSNDDSVLLTWNKKHYLLKRRPTSTGAYHFDDAKAGFVLIQIPTKSMLFDKKNMTRLADDCIPRP